MVNYQQIKDIESVHGCPFYLFDRQAFVRNYDEITNAFKSRYEKFILAYSYKTNYMPCLCSIINKKGSVGINVHTVYSKCVFITVIS